MTVTDTDRLAVLPLLHLATGSHRSNNNGQACILEAVAWVAGEAWSDAPRCVSPVLGAYGRNLNDVLPDDKRQRLTPLIPRLIGTAGDGQDEVRSLLALDWLIRVYTPAWLRLVPALVPDAELLASAGPITSLAAAVAVGDMVREVTEHSAAARDAARDAARAAAWAAAGDAAWAAAGDAAWAAAGAAAWNAAWDAAWNAAWDAAWNAARDAAWNAARDAARDALQPTVDSLQDSAIALFDRLIDATP